MSEYYGKEYNYDIWEYDGRKFEDFKSIFHAGDRPPDFTLPLLDGGEITLSKLRGKPVVIEFGSIT
ncbi:MAG: redoxin domain-containing protein [Chloroflexi bacterium]|nr:redoxin domain-containing protein [Chloroflexota bacterium]